MVTIAEVAREARVSKSAVSAAFRGSSSRSGTRLGQGTRQRIYEVARSLGYHPNPLAVGLNGGRTNTIGLLWSLGGPHSPETISRDMTLRMQKRGYLTHLADNLSDPEITLKLLGDFSRRRVDGIVLQADQVLQTPAIFRQLEGFDAALVVGGGPPKDDLRIDYLHHDRLPAFVEAADHLARIGRRRPAFLGTLTANRSKSGAFFGQARRHGMEVRPDAAVNLDADEKKPLIHRCIAALEKRFGGREFPFDALMCTSDELAVVAIDFLRRRGLRVPQDVAVVGFNDNPLNPFQTPPLASGDRRDGEVAAAVEEMLFNRLERPDLPPQRRSIAARFVWRESAGGRPIFDESSSETGAPS